MLQISEKASTQNDFQKIDLFRNIHIGYHAVMGCESMGSQRRFLRRNWMFTIAILIQSDFTGCDQQLLSFDFWYSIESIAHKKTTRSNIIMANPNCINFLRHIHDTIDISSSPKEVLMQKKGNTFY
ncbi:hypothetical protein BCR42DRAFT_396585 [Absidia repens]|uniref:Uncharacterized protein n=1 Tax=Absidia repens TaxID=90262 RepID=A0A1X2I3S0_9FUNG|nr:hypothetical protein BCR42DRAFT_396585 [Absidia repens]